MLPFAIHLFVHRTRTGLRLRAVGEKPQAAAAVGINVGGLRFAAVLASGMLAGLGGAALSTATLDRFEHHMPAGMGFMAVAAMVFGRWTPLGAAGAAAFFAFANALRIGLASSAPGLLEVVPAGLLLALPFLLTMVLLAARKPKASAAPAALGTPYNPSFVKPQEAGMNEVAEFPFHKGARGALYFVAVLLIVLVVTLPVAIWCFLRIGKAKVAISRTGVRAEGLILTDSFEFADVARLGLLKMPLAGGGVAGAIANAKLGGLGYGLNVVVQTRGGKTIKFISNQYERHEELIEKIKQAVPVPCEQLAMGAFSIKWPERAA